MGLFDKLKDFVAPPSDLDEQEYLELEDSQAIERTSDYELKGGKGMTQMNSDTKMILFEPRTFEEGAEIARNLKEKKAAVVNLHRLPAHFQQRIIDFLTGVATAIDGTIQKIGDNVYLCTPKSIGTTGSISLSLTEDE